VVLEQLQDHFGALERYELALKQQPDFAAALLNRGTLLLRLKRLDEALTNNRRLATRYPDWDAALYNLGETWLANGQWQAALDAYERALTITTTVAARGRRTTPRGRFYFPSCSENREYQDLAEYCWSSGSGNR